MSSPNELACWNIMSSHIFSHASASDSDTTNRRMAASTCSLPFSPASFPAFSTKSLTLLSSFSRVIKAVSASARAWDRLSFSFNAMSCSVRMACCSTSGSRYFAVAAAAPDAAAFAASCAFFEATPAAGPSSATSCACAKSMALCMTLFAIFTVMRRPKTRPPPHSSFSTL